VNQDFPCGNPGYSEFFCHSNRREIIIDKNVSTHWHTHKCILFTLQKEEFL